MSYSSNYYNYQIAVIFAILFAALLLLGMLVLGIYFAVSNMRNKKGSRLPSSAIRGRTEWRPASQQPQYITSTLPRQQQQPIAEGYARQSPAVQQQYVPYSPQQQQQYVVEQTGGGRIQELHPEYSYQQGPITWTTVSPVHHEHQQQPNYVGPSTSTNYHMSSV